MVSSTGSLTRPVAVVDVGSMKEASETEGFDLDETGALAVEKFPIDTKAANHANLSSHMSLRSSRSLVETK